MSRMWWYTLGALVLCVVNSELRRICEWRFIPISSMLPLLPFLAVIPHVWSLTYGGGWQRLPRPLLIAAWLWLGAFGYGLTIAVVSGNILSSSYTFASFVLPIGIGLWVAADRTPFARAYARITSLLFALTTVVSAYGIVQYVVAPEWDCLWLRGAMAEGALSFGRPEPFAIRVFSMLPSPGPFGTFMAIMLLLALPQLSIRRPWLLAQLPVWFVAFGLSLDRSGWLVFAFGAIVYLALTPRRGPLLAAAAISGALIVGFTLLLPAAVGNDTIMNTLNARFSTFSDLDRDRSSNDRRFLYDSSVAMIAQAPLGRGLGIFGTATKIGSPPTNQYIDSGFIARMVEMGPPGFCLFVTTFGLLGAIILGVWRQARCTGNTALQSVAGAAFAILSALFGFQLSGEIGGLPMLMLWLTSGLAIRGQSALAATNLIEIRELRKGGLYGAARASQVGAQH